MELTHRIFVPFLVIVALAGFVSSGRADTPPKDNSVLGNLKIIDANEARQKDPFAILRDKPMLDNPTLIPQLKATANLLPPQYLYELSRRLWLTDKAEAMEWFAVGMVRARYDALKCLDTTSHQGISYLPMIAPDVAKGAESDRAAFGEAGLRGMARPDLFIDSISPAWICNHGIKAINSALFGKPMSEKDWLRPPSEWESIREEVRKDLHKYFVEQGKPQDDPIPMTTSQFPRVSLQSPFAMAYNWLDERRIAWAYADKNADGKPITRLMVGTARGDKEEIATTTGLWCTGNGVVSYQTDRETLPDKTHKITLLTGAPGKGTSRTLELRSIPFGATFGAQSFGGSWGQPSDSWRMSPFDCRWENSAELSGPKNQIGWIPLLPGDGVIQFLPDNDRRVIRWITGSGKEVPLELDSRYVSLSGIRHVPWKGGYFISQSWSRFTSKEKALPKCIPGLYLYPREGRVEETCTPFDPDNTANAVMVHPTKAGWLRGTVYRNTAHGVKNGGIYLLRPDGKPEKLVDTQLESLNVSPDGCQVAFAHRATDRAAALEILDVCKSAK